MVSVPPPVKVTDPLNVRKVLALLEITVISPELAIVPLTTSSRLFPTVRLLPGLIVRLPMDALTFRVTEEAGLWLLLMQTFAPLLGTEPVLQLAGTFQFPEAPPTQTVSPAAQLAAPAI